MATYRKTNTLSVADAAYIAGLIDGEGTVTLSRRHRKDNRQLVVSISNTERPLLEYVLKTVGTGVLARKRISKEHHTPSLTYSVTNRQAISLLEQITPFLKTYKLERSQLILQDYIRLTPRNGKYSQELHEQREEFIRNFFEIHP